MSEHSYHDQVNKENIEKMRAVLQELPKFCKQFFRGIENTTSTRTRLGYALDLRIFFEFIQQNNNALRRTPIREYPLSLLDQLGREDIEEYLDYLELYYKDDKEYRNDERGKSRKLASLRSMYHYFYTSELIEKDVAALVPMPKLHEKEIIRLDPDEVATLLELVENGEELTETEKRYHRVTKTRDLALLTLLLGTGIRVSECVGLNLNDVDFKTEESGSYERAVMKQLYILEKRSRMRSSTTGMNAPTRQLLRGMKMHCFYPCRISGSASVL